MKISVGDKTVSVYGDCGEGRVPVVVYNSVQGDDAELYEACRSAGCRQFVLAVVEGINWNDEMTPWPAEPLFRKGGAYGGKADVYLAELTEKILPAVEEHISSEPEYFCLAGYSLGGLFAVYSLYKTDKFERIVSGSGSFWYPGFADYAKAHEFAGKPSKMYFSLGEKEKNTKNSLMSAVEERTLGIVEYYKGREIKCAFEMNPGGHFTEPDKRMARGIKWVLG